MSFTEYLVPHEHKLTNIDENAMYKRCAGLDVHKQTVTACRRNGKRQEIKTFGTTTAELLKLVNWLLEWKCTHVAMESTGEYWKPIYNLLEGSFEVLLVNAKHVKNVPGRKTDVSDAQEIERRIHQMSQPQNPEISDSLGFQKAVELLDTIPGVDKNTAEVIVAELGTDMSRFRTSKHAASWAGLSPGNNESGGKRGSGRTRKGDRALPSGLLQAAWAASHTKER